MKCAKGITLTVLVLAISCMVVLATGNSALAAVSGPCSECHTMHDSQGAGPMSTGGPYNALLLNDCIGCHTTTGSDPLANATPYVKGSGFTNDKCLAGGFFTTGFGSTDNHGDNNHSLGSEATPAGYNATSPDWYVGDVAGNGLTCAGATGCHGNETSVKNDMEAIKGGHHNTGLTYRMLYVGGTDSAHAVAGEGDPNYEEELIATDDTTLAGSTTLAHNIYSAGDDDVTISELCGKCHGNFHVQGDSPFVRHPTDVDIPHTGGAYSTTWEIVDNDGTPSTAYNDFDRKYNPLGFAGGDNETSTGRATCISCHRAHGSAQPDILRFAYDDQIAGSDNDWGCLGCHSLQR
ncbi:MAG: cytochrome c3 family protein [bacterium]